MIGKTREQLDKEETGPPKATDMDFSIYLSDFIFGANVAGGRVMITAFHNFEVILLTTNSALL